MVAIKISRLKKHYKNTKAVNNISFSIEKGEIFGFLGPNGAGKTTTINCITQLSTITSGSIKINGFDVEKNYLDAKMQLGLSPQELKPDLSFSIWEVMVYQAGYYGLSPSKAKKRAEELLREFGLWDKRKATAMELSGGMKRKLSICKALVHSPSILILDEPTAGLDVEARIDLWGTITSLRKKGMTVVLTTHYIEEAEKLCDRIGIINKGKIVKLEKTKKLLSDLSRNVIQFHLPNGITLPKEVLNQEHKHKGKILEVFVAHKDQNKVLRALLRAFESTNVKVENFVIEHDSLENIFRRIVNEV